MPLSSLDGNCELFLSGWFMHPSVIKVIGSARHPIDSQVCFVCASRTQAENESEHPGDCRGGSGEADEQPVFSLRFRL